MLVKKELYVLMYGKQGAETVIKKRNSRKKALSFLMVPAFLTGVVTDTGAAGIIGLPVLTWVAIWLLPELLMSRKCKELKLNFKMDMPDFLDVTALLLEAGQPLWYAVENASQMGNSALCRRINEAFTGETGMEANRNPEILLQGLADEVKVPVVSSVVSALVQNSRKGERELAAVLRTQSSICRGERKGVAEEIGNRASNLLLIPSGMVFVAILLMLMTPALMQLNIF